MQNEFTLKLGTSLDGLLPSRIAAILGMNGIHTVKEVQSAYPYQLSKIRGLGMLRLKQIETVLFPGESFTPARILSPIRYVRGSSLNGVLNPATVRALARGGITTAEKLRKTSSKELLKIQGLGQSMVQEIERDFFEGKEPTIPS